MKINIKKISLVAIIFFTLSSFLVLSTKKNSLQSTHITKLLASEENLIPISIRYEDKTAYVNFVLSAQWYTMDLSATNRDKEIELINNAIKSETPLKILFDDRTGEIVSVIEASPEAIEYYKKIYVQPEPEVLDKAALALVSVIPNQAALTTLFTKIKNSSCGASTAPTICTTFRYAVDGCYARAHKAKQLTEASGYSCRKQFVYGNLRASTGTCCVSWGYHVAILVEFKNASNVTEERIIDPSLFPSGPVLPLTWRNACKNSTCGTASVTNYANVVSSIYYRNTTGSAVIYDNNFVNTNCVLTKFKNLSGCSPSPAPSVSTCGF
jgi:Glutaminase